MFWVEVSLFEAALGVSEKARADLQGDLRDREE